MVGLNFDFVVLNLTKHSSYLIYNAVLYFSSAVQRQYREKYGVGQVCVFGNKKFSSLCFFLVLIMITGIRVTFYIRNCIIRLLGMFETSNHYFFFFPVFGVILQIFGNFCLDLDKILVLL